MFGSEGELGSWHMPEVEPDLQQKREDNLNTFKNAVNLLRLDRQAKLENPDNFLKFTRKSQDDPIYATKKVIKIWEGVASGAMIELNAEGYEDITERILKGKDE